MHCSGTLHYITGRLVANHAAQQHTNGHDVPSGTITQYRSKQRCRKSIVKTFRVCCPSISEQCACCPSTLPPEQQLKHDCLAASCCSPLNACSRNHAADTLYSAAANLHTIWCPSSHSTLHKLLRSAHNTQAELSNAAGVSSIICTRSAHLHLPCYLPSSSDTMHLCSVSVLFHL
jgi:hypothetical protein